jgi:hypothetical protein
MSCRKLINSFESQDRDICIVRELKTQYNSDGTISVTEFDCPILSSYL